MIPRGQHHRSAAAVGLRSEVAADNRWNKHSFDLEFSMKVETELNNLLRSESMLVLRAGFYWPTDVSIK